MQEPAAPQAGGRRRGDAFDPGQNPNAPGAPRALGGGQLPIANEAPFGAPGGRGPGEPLDLGATSPRAPAVACRPARSGRQRRADDVAALGDAEGRVRPRHRLHQRRDYALAEETMKNFAQKYPRDPLVADSHSGSAKAISSASNIATPPKPFSG